MQGIIARFRSAETTAGHAGAEDATCGSDIAGELNEEVQFRTGDLEVVPQGPVGSRHEGAEGGVVTLAEFLRGLPGPGDLGDHVAGTSLEGQSSSQ